MSSTSRPRWRPDPLPVQRTETADTETDTDGGSYVSSNHGAEGHTTALPQPTPWTTRNPPPQRGMRRPRNDQVLTTRVGLQIPDVLSFDEWERAGRQLAGVVDSSSWWL